MRADTANSHLEVQYHTKKIVFTFLDGRAKHMYKKKNGCNKRYLDKWWTILIYLIFIGFSDKHQEI
jgi:hypothetical protein